MLEPARVTVLASTGARKGGAEVGKAALITKAALAKVEHKVAHLDALARHGSRTGGCVAV